MYQTTLMLKAALKSGTELRNRIGKSKKKIKNKIKQAMKETGRSTILVKNNPNKILIDVHLFH